jgi:hypothetical protein
MFEAARIPTSPDSRANRRGHTSQLKKSLQARAGEIAALRRFPTQEAHHVCVV